MAIYRVFFFNRDMDMFGGTGYDALAETANEAVAKLTVLRAVPIEYTAHVYSAAERISIPAQCQAAIPWSGLVLKGE